MLRLQSYLLSDLHQCMNIEVDLFKWLTQLQEDTDIDIGRVTFWKLTIHQLENVHKVLRELNMG